MRSSPIAAPVHHSTLREGVIAGIIGASAVAIWFLFVDALNGRLLYTPQLLGRAALGLFGPPGGEGLIGQVVGYTILHYAAFIALGLIASAIAHKADDAPHVLAGALLLFVIFEVAFYGFVALLSQWQALGDLAWYQIGAANFVAGSLMGGYLWRAHRQVGGQFAYALGGRE